MKDCPLCGEQGLVPNAETIEAMEAARHGEVDTAHSVDDMFEKIMGGQRRPAVLTSLAWRAPETWDEVRRRAARKLRPRRVMLVGKK